SCGNASARPARAAAQPTNPVAAVRRRTRNASTNQRSVSAGSTSARARRTFPKRWGLIASRKVTVSLLMIIASRKLAVIRMISYLSCDSRIRMTITTSDSAADTAGRRNTASQKKLSRPQVRQNTTFCRTATSLQSMRPSAAKWSGVMSRIRRMPAGVAASDAAQRLVTNAMEGGMASGPCPAMTHLNSRHTDRRHKTALNLSFQGQTARPGDRVVDFPPAVASLRWSAASKSLNQTRVDQQPIEASRLRTAGAEIEQAAATLEDFSLLREGGIERHSRPLQHHQRKVRRVERIERG